MSTDSTRTTSVFGLHTIEFKRWNGEKLGGETLVGFKVMIATTRGESSPPPPPPAPPRVVDDDAADPMRVFQSHESLQQCAKDVLFAVASSDTDACVISLDQLASFLVKHNAHTFVCQNAALDFHLVRCLLEQKTPGDDGDATHTDALEWWMQVVDECRLRDVHVLDALIRLALEDGSPKPRPLVEILAQYTEYHEELQKHECATNNNNAHYHIGKRWFSESVAARYAHGDASRRVQVLVDDLAPYAIRDVFLLQQAYGRMQSDARMIMDMYREEIFPSAFQQYGPLSEGIQIKGNIVLSDITKNGIAIDVSLVDRVRTKMERRLNAAVTKLQQRPDWAGLFHLTVQDGKIVPVRESGKPSVVQARLEELLLQAAAEITDKYSIDVTLPVGQGGKKVSLSTKVWSEYAQYHDFIAAWLDMEQAAHYATFLAHLKGDRAHPEYSVMVRNGRSAAQNPPIQQTPRKGGFREIFRASPGHVLCTVDYDFIELCTLAAVCLARYGQSTLANVICQGIDPHSFTASMIEGVPLDEFMTWKSHSDANVRAKFQNLRQRAKAVNFGIPSGLTAAGLGHYAKSAYMVELSDEDAEKFRKSLVEHVYPELSLYLKESDMQRLAANLNVPEKVCWHTFAFKKGDRSQAIEGSIRNIVRGQKHRKRDGKEYNAFFVRKIWNGLRHIARDPQMCKVIDEATQAGEGNETVFKELFGRPVVTLTGRVRGKVGFTQACNTPFSGLAADGAKLALWNLYQLGYKLVAFIHDEIVLELPETSTGTYTKEAERIQHVICGSMRELTGPVPISSSLAISHVWSKNAKAMYNDAGELIPWEIDDDVKRQLQNGDNDNDNEDDGSDNQMPREAKR